LTVHAFPCDGAYELISFGTLLNPAKYPCGGIIYGTPAGAPVNGKVQLNVFGIWTV
jgi:hypothetical protein